MAQMVIGLLPCLAEAFAGMKALCCVLVVFWTLLRLAEAPAGSSTL